MKYLPFLDGTYSTAPRLIAMAKAGKMDQLIFQMDDRYDLYLANKSDCRKEDMHKYYLEKDLYPDTAAALNKFIATALVRDYPEIFTLSSGASTHVLANTRTGETLRWKDDWIDIDQHPYLSLFDALSAQVQEDLAIFQLDHNPGNRPEKDPGNEKQRPRDWLAAIHLSAPNHWSPAEKIGRPFGAIHSVVPGMEKLNEQYTKMLLTLVQKGPFIRFAWGIATDTRLNHHPDPPPNIDRISWQGRAIEDNEEKIYLRVERQTTTGIPTANAFLFTIRTWFYDIDDLTIDEKKALQMAVESMSPASLDYKGLTGKTGVLRKRLLTTR